ncbi:MAG: exodeoxyribonuclease V subunit gamma [Polyangiaceae bacterium]
MFHVYRSNRTECLAEGLAALLREPVGSPLSAEVVVVQSRGMERWLSMALAARLGVAAGVEFPFPRAFVERVLGVPRVDGQGARFTRERLRFALLEELQHLRDPAVLRYLKNDETGIKRYELATELANVFDQYVVYRPEQVLAWESGEGNDFQASLWRNVVSRLGAEHMARRVEAVRRNGAQLVDLPGRVSIFGTSALPPLYLEVLHALSQRVDVHLFQHSPSDAYWAELRKEQNEGALADLGLLASWGRQGAELAELLESRVQYQELTDYVDPDTGTALGQLQSDLMQLTRPTSKRVHVLPTTDESVEIAVCHSATRELQALRDRIWGWLHADPSLEPHDILVMVPDVDAYYPHIEAVFARDLSEKDFIPYRVADRAERKANPVALAILQLLTLAEGRLPATACVDLLQLEPVRRRFGVSAAQLPAVIDLVAESGVRWGRDAAHREQMGQPAVDDNTWRFGLARLLLGYCMPSGSHELFAGVAPVSAVEGERAELVGRLALFAETLFECCERLSGLQTPAQWCDNTLACMNALLHDGETHASDLQAVRRAVIALASDALVAGCTEALHREVWLAALGARLDEERRVQEFMSGGVTFAAMLPMRSIPFRVICLLGLNDDAFPRADVPRSFDLTAAERRLGDRSLRDEDRYLFLEAVLCARERLYLSHVGRDIQDNSERPPSVVIEELLDVMDQTHGFVEPPPPGRQLELYARPLSARQHVRVQHALGSHSPRYFDGRDPRFYSYSTTWAAAATAAVGPSRERPSPLRFSAAPAERDSVDLSDVSRFFDNPARYLAERRLGVRLRRDDARVQDREPVELSPLERYAAGDFLLQRLLENRDIEQVRALLVARGELPVGELGQGAFRALLLECQPIAQEVRAFGERLTPRQVEIEFDGLKLQGALSRLHAQGQLHYGFGRTNAKRRLRLWLEHLALCATSRPAPSTLVMRGEGTVARSSYGALPAEHALRELEVLLALFREGQAGPLPFAPETSLAFAVSFLQRSPAGDAQRAHKDALKKFDSRQGFGEAADEYLSLAFPDLELLAHPRFDAVALAVFTPLLAAEEPAP